MLSANTFPMPIALMFTPEKSVPPPQGSYCYRVKFGAFDAASANKGLEDAWIYGENKGYASAGDYSSFDKLGLEVNKAIASIKKKLPGAQILS